MTEPTDPPLPLPHALILAAGAATRFGKPKQSQQWHGKALLLHALDAAEAACGPRVIVVVGAHADTVHLVLQSRMGQPDPPTLCINEGWAEGVGGSIAVGMGMLPPTAPAVLILLADQPRVDAHCLKPMVRLWQQQPQRLVAARYADTIGVPAIFPRQWFADLSLLRGDRGAASLLRSGHHEVVAVDVPQAADDVDTPQDLAALAGHVDASRPSG